MSDLDLSRPSSNKRLFANMTQMVLIKSSVHTVEKVYFSQNVKYTCVYTLVVQNMFIRYMYVCVIGSVAVNN